MIAYLALENGTVLKGEREKSVRSGDCAREHCCFRRRMEVFMRRGEQREILRGMRQGKTRRSASIQVR
jgi:hypothetical protein